jgi:hypothetical protein
MTSPSHLLLIEIMIRNSHSAYALTCCILSHIDKIKQNLFIFKSLHVSRTANVELNNTSL